MKPIRFMFAFLVLTGCSEQKLPSLQTLYSDYVASLELKGEKYEEALAQYYAMLESDADRVSTHSNIGVLLQSLQKNEEALKSLQYALVLAEKSKDGAGIFSVRYNLGKYFEAQKKYDLALENYQGALEANPTSIETKTNIELLIQQQQKDKQQQGKDGEKKQDQSGQGQGEGDKKEDKKDGPDGKDKDQKDQKDSKDQDQKDKKDDSKDGKEKDQKRQSSPKYQPRPFKGDQLSEGDVKKILGELREQEQKIRSHFDKNEKGKSKGNEKDW